MAYSHGPRTVTDGLILFLDAGNTKSYPGTGSSWYDMSRSRAHATISNISYSNGVMSPTNTSAFGYLDRNTKTLLGTGLQTISVEAWARFTGNGTGQYMFQLKQNTTTGSTLVTIRAGAVAGQLGVLRRNAANTVHTSIDGDGYNDGIWHHVMGCLSPTTCTVYIDGIVIGSDSDGVRACPSDANVAPSIFCTSAGSNHYTGDIGVIKVYNRELSQDEVIQNYISLKGRFGL